MLCCIGMDGNIKELHGVTAIRGEDPGVGGRILGWHTYVGRWARVGGPGFNSSQVSHVSFL